MKKTIACLLAVTPVLSVLAENPTQKHNLPWIKNGILGDKENARRIEVCGEKYVYEGDSIRDYKNEDAQTFPARAKVLAGPQEAFLAKLFAIRQAKHTIDISTYIFKAEPTSLAMLGEIKRAVARGVSVRFLVDSSGSIGEGLKGHQTIKDLLNAPRGVNPLTGKKATVDVATFRPIYRVKSYLHWAYTKVVGKEEYGTTININRRSHDKIFLVDMNHPKESIAIIGGRNMSDSYFGLPKIDSHTYEDMETIIRDKDDAQSDLRIASTVGEHFHRLFCHKGNDWLATRGWFTRTEAVEEGRADLLLSQTMQDLMKIHGQNRTYPLINTGFVDANVQFANEIQNITRKHKDAFRDPNQRENGKSGLANENAFMDQTAKIIRQAQDQIDIVSPYLYLNASEIARLQAWVTAKPGRKIRIISNSIMTSDNMLAQTLVDNDVAPLLLNPTRVMIPGADGKMLPAVYHSKDNKVEFYAFGLMDAVDLGGTVHYGKLHSKYFIVDNKICLIGSHNGDPRSRYYNSEVGFFIHSDAACTELQSEFEKTRVRSHMWGSKEWMDMYNHEKMKSKRTQIRHMKKFLNEYFPQVKSLI